MDIETTTISSSETIRDFHEDKYLILVSAEGFEFYISQKAASHSKMLKELMSGSGMYFPFGPIDNFIDQRSLGEKNSVQLPDISTDVLEMVCQYLCERSIKEMHLYEFKPLQELDPKREDHRAVAIELLLAANYMDC